MDFSLNLTPAPGTGNPVDQGLLAAAGILLSDFLALAPASNFCFLDEDQQTISDGAFGVNDAGTWPYGPFDWDDLPGARHSRGANLSFLDGHVAGHQWLYTPKVMAAYGGDTPIANSLDNQDFMWVYNRKHSGQLRDQLLGLPFAQ